MQPDNHPFELIGERLRSDWREIETAPLPARITMLLQQLKRREASEQAHRPAVNVVDAATSLGEGRGLEAKDTPLTVVASRRMALAEV
jgi:hypothetical protein